MHNKTLFRPTFLFAALTASAMAAASTVPPQDGPVSVRLSARTGLGYDSNVFRAPRSPYTNYALAAQPQVTPQVKSGVFVPYVLKAEAEKAVSGATSLLGEASLGGRKYLTAGLANADEYEAALSGGSKFTFGRDEGASRDSLYVGALIENHHQVYFDRANGNARTASNRYNYMSTGGEAKYKRKIGEVDFSAHGKYVVNDFETPVVGSELDHTYAEVGADADFPLAGRSKLKVGLAHWVEDYSIRHARDRNGVLSAANPLLVYTYDNADVTFHSRISSDWRVYLDYDHTRRTDGYVNYNDYSENRFGARVLFEQERFKTRLALHHWKRSYPNAFAFDNPIGGAKAYSGNTLKLKAELEQAKGRSLWAELAYNAQNTTDLRYDYTRTQLMAGMSWEY